MNEEDDGTCLNFEATQKVRIVVNILAPKELYCEMREISNSDKMYLLNQRIIFEKCVTMKSKYLQFLFQKFYITF